jgi:hypothetical protein
MRLTLRVIVALGKLREQPMIEDVRPTGRRMDRAQFLRLCAGASVGIGILLTGKSPALAGARACAWVEANRNALPQRYEEVTALAMSYRREIFKASSPRVRSQLFVQQLTRYGTDHAASLTAQQRAVLDSGIALFSNTHMFALCGLDDHDYNALDALRTDSVRAFGASEAGALFAALTPPASLGHALSADASSGIDDASTPFAPRDGDDCSCSNASDYCTDPRSCVQVSGDFCDHTDGGCGTGWLYDCDGLCLS